MKTTFNSLLFFLSFLLIVGCNPNQTKSATNNEVVNNPKYGTLQEQGNPVQFELIQEYVFDEDSELLVGSIWDFEVDDQGNMYFYDYELSRLTSLDEDGNLRWTSGQEGKGPGDLMQLRGMVLHNNQLYISNISGSRLDIFNLDGEYLSSTDFGKELNSSSLLGITGEETFILYQNVIGTVGYKVIVVKFNGTTFEELTSFVIDQSGGVEIPQNVGLGMPIHYFNEKVIAADGGKDYVINFYNLEGNITKKVTRDFDKLVGIGSVDGRTMSFGSLQVPIELSNGHFFSLASWPEGVDDPNQEIKKRANPGYQYPDYKHSFDLFNENGTLLYSKEGSGNRLELGYPKYVDDNDIVYFMETNPVLKLKKYQLVFD